MLSKPLPVHQARLRGRTARLLSLLLSAGWAESRAQSVRDSAGVHIVENVRPAWTDATAWRVAPIPILSIGDGAGGIAYEFSSIRGLALLSDGRILVANAASHELRLFDARGRFLRSIGRRGNGPGEFQELSGLARLDGDRLAVQHIPAPPLTATLLFDRDGRFVRGGLTPNRLGTLAPVAWFSDGSYLAWRLDAATSGVAGVRVDSAELIRVAPDWQTAWPVGRFARSVRAGDASVGQTAVARHLVFGPRGFVRPAKGGLYHAFAEKYSINVHSFDGRLRRIVRRSVEPLPLPPGATDAFRAWYERTNRIPEIIQGKARQQLTAMRAEHVRTLTFAGQLPHISALLVDDEENVWARRYDVMHDMPGCGAQCIASWPAAAEWDVFDPTGRWLGTVAIPAGFTPTVIVQNTLLGIWRDVDEVEHVRLYQLIKSRSIEEKPEWPARSTRVRRVPSPRGTILSPKTLRHRRQLARFRRAVPYYRITATRGGPPPSTPPLPCQSASSSR